MVVVWTPLAAAASSAAPRRWSRSACAPPSALSRCGCRMPRPGHLASVTADSAAAVATADASAILDSGRGRHVDIGSRTCLFQFSRLR